MTSLFKTKQRHICTGAALCAAVGAWTASAARAAPAPGTVYLPLYNENAVEVIDTHASAVITKIPVGIRPITLRLSKDASKIYVDNFGLFPWQINVIDTATNTVVKTINTFGAPYASDEMSRDGRYDYVPTNAHLVQVIDTSTDTIVKSIPTGALPISVQVSPDGGKLYVFTAVNTLDVYDTATGRKLSGILINGIAPAWSAISNDGRNLYAVNFTTSNISKIDTSTMQIVDTIALPFGGSPLSATLTPDGSQLWVADVGTYDITIIDTATDKTLDVIHTATTPTFVGFSADGKQAYVSDLGQVSDLPALLRPTFEANLGLLPPGFQGDLVIYDTATRKPLGAPIKTGTAPVAGVYF